MAQRVASNELPKIRSHHEIREDRDDPLAKLGRQAIETLTTTHGMPEVEINMRIDFFEPSRYFGSGRRWEERFNISRKRAGRLADRLRQDAEDLRRAIQPGFKSAIRYKHSVPPDKLCDSIRYAALLIEQSLKETSDRTADWTLEPKRELTQFVWRRAGKPHPLDRELSDLIAAILCREYTYEDQRKFRERHCQFDATDTSFQGAAQPDKIEPIKS